MEQRYSPEDHLSKLTQSWIGSILIIGAILFPVLEFMDYFASPANFKRFMIYRLVISGILIILYYLNGLKRSKTYQYGIAVAGTALCAVTVELAVLQSGGQSSTYYAAMIILAICCLSFVPFNMSRSFILVGIIYGIYVAPIMLSETITGGVFVSNNAFLVATFVIGLLLRYNNQKLIVTELQLRAELSEDKRKLELHSDSLAGELKISGQKYRALFDNANDGIAVLDRTGVITDANLRFCELHGFECEPVLGTNFRLLEIESTRGEIDDRLKRILNHESLVYEAEHYRKDGTRIRLEISSRAIDIGGVPHIQSFFRDITEKMKLQEQVLQSQKMEAMGVLAGGIAHDFNNVLTAILGHTEVLRRHVKSDEFGNRSIKTIEDAARRAGQMVSKLLSFARKESLELVPTELNAVVTDTVELLGRALIERDIAVQVALDPRVPAVSGDSIHLEQVIANLVMNSMDAMPGGGTITISTVQRQLGHDTPQVSPFLPAGNYVVLTIRDTGTGIPRELMERIFDPFYTTKPAGKGTGLGLAMAYGIVKSHKGEIRVDSREGGGATFEIYLPVSKQEAPLPAGDTIAAALPESAQGEWVFVVDDEKDVLSYIKDTLDAQGYTVITADSPEYARDLFRKISGDIDVVIADIVMPVMSGAELAGIFKEISPTVKVIGISGFDEGDMVRETRHLDCFLKKPFDGASLLTCIRRVLDSDEKSSAGNA